MAARAHFEGDSAKYREHNDSLPNVLWMGHFIISLSIRPTYYSHTCDYVTSCVRAIISLDLLAIQFLITHFVHFKKPSRSLLFARIPKLALQLFFSSSNTKWICCMHNTPAFLDYYSTYLWLYRIAGKSVSRCYNMLSSETERHPQLSCETTNKNNNDVGVVREC